MSGNGFTASPFRDAFLRAPAGSACRTVDAIVTGAGPAGATAARRIAQAGYIVLLFDKEPFPRYKACGGCLGPRSTARLPFPLADIPHMAIQRITFRLRGGSPVVWELPAGTPFYTVMRSDLDARLAQEAVMAGAELHMAETVLSVAIEGNGSHMLVTTPRAIYRAQYVVGADGAMGVVRHSLGLPRRGEVGMALECEIPVSGETYRRFEGTVFFDVAAAIEGYAWVFPKLGHLSVGIGSARGGTRLHAPLEEFIVTNGLVPEGGLAGLDVHHHPLPLAWPGEAVRAGNAILAGDSAGVADGFGGEGIGPAIASGELAGDVVARALGGDETALAAYGAELDRRVRGDHRFATIMGHIVRRFPDAAYRMLTSAGEGRSVILPLMLGQITFGQALRNLPQLRALDPALRHTSRSLGRGVKSGRRQGN